MPAPTESFHARERRLRLLVAAPFVPVAPGVEASHGGGRAVGSLLSRLAERHRVALVCLRGENEPEVDQALRARCEVVEEVLLPTAAARRLRVTRLGKLVGAPPDIVMRTRSASYGERLAVVATAFRPDVVQIEMAEMAQYLPALNGCSAPRVLVDHDPGASAAHDRRFAASGLRRFSRALDEIAWRGFSRRTLAGVNAAVVFTARDARGVQALASKLPIHRIPISVELPGRPLDPRGGDPPTVLFAGGYVHPPNADAALRLIRSIFPRVRARHPELVLELVGAQPTQEMTALAGAGIVITGQVPSVTPYLDRAAVVVVPVRLGGGMRVKVLEALASGKAVVASPRAVEGLELVDGQGIVIADSDEEFCTAISELVESVERRVSLGRDARSWAEANLGWEQVVLAYEDLYRNLLAADE